MKGNWFPAELRVIANQWVFVKSLASLGSMKINVSINVAAGCYGSYLYCYFHIIMVFHSHLSIVSLHKILILSSHFGSAASPLIPWTHSFYLLIHFLKLWLWWRCPALWMFVLSVERGGEIATQSCTKIGPQKYMLRVLDICPDDEHLQQEDMI